MTIDNTGLWRDLKEKNLGTLFGGEFGGAAPEAEDVDRMPLDRVVAMTRRCGLRPENYAVPGHSNDNDYNN